MRRGSYRGYELVGGWVEKDSHMLLGEGKKKEEKCELLSFTLLRVGGGEGGEGREEG